MTIGLQEPPPPQIQNPRIRSAGVLDELSNREIQSVKRTFCVCFAFNSSLKQPGVQSPFIVTQFPLFRCPLINSYENTALKIKTICLNKIKIHFLFTAQIVSLQSVAVPRGPSMTVRALLLQLSSSFSIQLPHIFYQFSDKGKCDGLRYLR